MDSSKMTARLQQLRAKDEERKDMMEALCAELAAYEVLVAERQYTVVLVDGDNVPFLDDYYKTRDGGIKLGTELGNAVNGHLKGFAGYRPSAPVLTKVYASTKGVADTLVHYCVIQDGSDYNSSTEGLAITPYAEYVNVGVGKERADDKIKEMLDFYIQDPACFRIFFAGQHDNGYASKLRHLQENEAFLRKLVLLKTFRPGREYSDLQFDEVSFDKVFRVTPRQQPPSPSQPAQSGTSVRPRSTSPKGPYASVNGSSEPSWTPSYMIFNKYYKRLDAALPATLPYSDAQLKHIIANSKREMGNSLCNMHHLRQDCNGGCNYNHEPELSAPQKVALAKKARKVHCPLLGKCRSLRCYKGHVCTLGNQCPRRNGQDCDFQDAHSADMDMSTHYRMFKSYGVFEAYEKQVIKID